MTDPTPDRREADWRDYESTRLQMGMCPHSGLRLHGDGEGRPGTLSCDVCDCFGYPPSWVGQ